MTFHLSGREYSKMLTDLFKTQYIVYKKNTKRYCNLFLCMPTIFQLYTFHYSFFPPQIILFVIRVPLFFLCFYGKSQYLFWVFVFVFVLVFVLTFFMVDKTFKNLLPIRSYVTFTSHNTNSHCILHVAFEFCFLKLAFLSFSEFTLNRNLFEKLN